METDENSEREMIKHMWDTANVITAFTVAQSAGVMYFAIEKVDVVRNWGALVWVAAVLILGGAGAYIRAVVKCYDSEVKLRRLLSQHSTILEVSQSAFRGRVATIVIFNVLAAVVTVVAQYIVAMPPIC